MTDDQIASFADRFCVAFEKISGALEGLNETYRREYERRHPEKQFREAVVTRLPNQEDRLREEQGASRAPLAEWLSDVEREEDDAEDVGVRERQWLEARKPTTNVNQR